MTHSVTVDRKALVGAMAALKHAIPKRTTIPVCACIKLRAAGNELSLAATDLEVFGKVTLRRLAGEGDFIRVLPAAILSPLVKDGETTTVLIEAEEGFSAKVDGSLVVGFDPVDYPAVPEDCPVQIFSITAGEFAEAVKETAFAKSTEVVRYALQGILLDADPKKGLSLVASDGKVLSWKKAGSVGIQKKARAILLDKTARAAQMVCETDPKANLEAFVKIEEKEVTQIQLRVGNVRLWARPIDGHFPDYRAVVPDYKGGWTMGRKELLKALTALKPVQTPKTQAVRFTLGDGKAKLFARTQDIGERQVELAAKGAGQLEIVLNPGYVEDFLKALPERCSRVTLLGTAKDKAALWRAVGVDGLNYVQMPLTVNLQPADVKTEIPVEDEAPKEVETKAAQDETVPVPDETNPAAGETESAPAETPAPAEETPAAPAAAEEEPIITLYGPDVEAA